jgi:hypothetical protein
MAITSQQQRDTAVHWANENFVTVNATANYTIDDIAAAIAAVDSAFDTTLNQAVAAGHGAQTVWQAMAAIIPAPFSGATAQQKALLVSNVTMKRVGIL